MRWEQSPESFRNRRTALQATLGPDALVLGTASPAYRSLDSEYAYRGDANVFYLTGLRESEAVVVLRGDAHDMGFVVFLKERDPAQEQWTGRRVGTVGAEEALGANAAYPISELETRLPALLRDAPRVYHSLGGSDALDRAVGAALVHGRTRGWRTGTGTRSMVDPGLLLEPLRMRKDPQEVEAIRRACALTAEAFAHALPHARPDAGEWEVQAELELIFRRGRAAPAFATIVGAGQNGCVLHYVENEARISAGDLVLVDGGADLDMYCGDVTRTVPASGSFTAEQRDVYEIVLAAQRAAVEAVAPGGPVSHVHAASTRVITQGLTDLGVLTGDLEELVTNKAWEPFFPHQTSHWLGLDVHDVGAYAAAGAPVNLEAGMVLTIEPGLYFPPGRDGVPAHLAGIGIRLEDDVLVTPDGRDNLTEDLPIEPDDVEALMGSGG